MGVRERVHAPEHAQGVKVRDLLEVGDGLCNHRLGLCFDAPQLDEVYGLRSTVLALRKTLLQLSLPLVHGALWEHKAPDRWESVLLDLLTLGHLAAHGSRLKGLGFFA